MSAFAEWFRAQFGPAPSRRLSWDIERAVVDARATLLALERELSDAREYERRKDAALKAWNAAQPKEPGK